MQRSVHALVGLVLVGTTSVGCQPKKAPQDAPSDNEYAQDSPEGQCLARANATIALPKDPPTSVDVAHILVRHRDLERPDGATQTRGGACLHALAALEALQGGAEWNDVVNQYSDSGKANHGELGTIHADEVTPAFAHAAFSLDHNELSYVVETDRGFHVILRH